MELDFGDFQDFNLASILTPVGKKTKSMTPLSSGLQRTPIRRLSMSSTDDSPSPMRRPRSTCSTLDISYKFCRVNTSVTPSIQLAGALEGLQLWPQTNSVKKEKGCRTRCQSLENEKSNIQNSDCSPLASYDPNRRGTFQRHKSQPYLKSKKDIREEMDRERSKRTQKDKENIGLFKVPLPIPFMVMDTMPANGHRRGSASIEVDVDCDLPSLMDETIDTPNHTILPTVSGDGPHSYITPKTMAQVLAGDYSSKYSAVYIFDTRYPYEYEGGHIVGAINVYEGETFDHHIRKIRKEQFSSDNPSNLPVCIIIHCEFSMIRGPRMYERLRKEDRKQNFDQYPQLDFPELYVLKGGYCEFFKQQKSHCVPQVYVRMRDKAHLNSYSQTRCRLKRYSSWSGQSHTESRGLPRFNSALPQPSCRSSDLFGSIDQEENDEEDRATIKRSTLFNKSITGSPQLMVDDSQSLAVAFSDSEDDMI